MQKFALVPNVLNGENLIDFNKVTAVIQSDEGGSMLLLSDPSIVISTPLSVLEVYDLIHDPKKTLN